MSLHKEGNGWYGRRANTTRSPLPFDQSQQGSEPRTDWEQTDNRPGTNKEWPRKPTILSLGETITDVFS